MRRTLSLGWIGLGLALLFYPGSSSAFQVTAGELVVVDATAPPPSLDPFKVYGTQLQSFYRLIYAPLFDRDVNGKLITPLLERWGQTDPLTWEFRLRESIRFHDGGELGAADVAFSLERIVDPRVGSPRRQEFEELDKILVVDRLTIRVITKRPYALLPARLSQFSMILPDRLRGRSESEFFQNPIGLGPFRLVELTRDQAVLAAFPDFYGGASKVPRIVFRFLSDPADRLRRLLDGTVDILTNVLPQQVDTLRRARDVQLMKRNSIRFTEILLDTASNPLARGEVRHALRYGTDVEGLVKYVARGNGRALATLTLPEDFGFNPDLQPTPFDPVKARSLLGQAGYPRGFQLSGLATHDTRTLATAVAAQWTKLGVALNIVVEDRAQAIARWIRERDRHHFLFVDPTSIMFDAAFQLRVLLDPHHPMSRSSNPRAFELLNQSDAERDPEARAKLLKEIQAIVHEQCLVVPLYQVVDLYGVRNRVRGFVPSVDTILRLVDVTLAP